MFNFALHRKMVQMKSGTRLLRRPLKEDDFEKLMGLFSLIPDEEARTLKHDIKDEEMVKKWCSNIDFDDVLSLVACTEDKIVGDITLHLGKGPYRHTAEIRIVLAPEYRGKKLGMIMLNEMEEVARRLELMFLTSEVLLHQIGLIRAFRRLGYDLRCILDDNFMYPDCATNDTTILIKRLVQVEHF